MGFDEGMLRAELVERTAALSDVSFDLHGGHIRLALAYHDRFGQAFFTAHRARFAGRR